MAKFGRDKIALALACASILGGKASAMNTIKNGVKNSQVSGLARVGINASGSKNNLTPYISHAGAGLGGTALGMVLGWLLFHNKKESDKKEVDALRQDYEAGKKIYIDFRKDHCANKRSVRGLYFNNDGLFWYGGDNLTFDDAVTTQYPALRDKKDVNFQQKRAEIRKAYRTFSSAYEEIKLKELWEIANKHKISFNSSLALTDGYFDARLYFICVEKAKDKNGELSVSIWQYISEKPINKTKEFNVEEPSNDDQKNKKDFYDAVVAWANQDEVIKAILLGDEKKDEKKEEKKEDNQKIKNEK